MLKFNLKKSWAVTRLNLNRFIVMFIIIGVSIAASALPNFIQVIVSNSGNAADNLTPSIAFYVFAFPVFSAIFLASSSFYGTMRLNAKKKDFFLGALFLLLIAAFTTALFSTLIHYTLVPLIQNNFAITYWTPQGVFGWADTNPFIAFLQTFGFIFFATTAVFIFVSLQDRWIGWALAAFVIAGISVFSSVSILRTHIWGSLFRLILFGHPALQLLFTVFGGLALYSLYLLILRKKKI